MKKYITFFLSLLGAHAAMAGPIAGAQIQVIELPGYGDVFLDEQLAILGDILNAHQSNSTTIPINAINMDDEEYEDEEKKPVASSSRLNRRRSSVLTLTNNENPPPSINQEGIQNEMEDVEDDVTMEEDDEPLREVLFYDHGPVRITLVDDETGTREHFEFTEITPIDEVWNIEPDFDDPATYILAALQAMEELLRRVYMIEDHLNDDDFNDTEFGHVFRSVHQAHYAMQPYWQCMRESYRGCLYELMRSTLKRLESLAFEKWLEKLERAFQEASNMRFIMRLNESDAILESLRLVDPNDVQKVLNGIKMLRELIYQRPYIAQPGGPNTPLSPLLARLADLEEKATSLATELQSVVDPIYTRDLLAQNRDLNSHWLFAAIQAFDQKLAQFDQAAQQRFQCYYQYTTKQLRPMLRKSLRLFLNEYIRFRHSNIDDLPENGHMHERRLFVMFSALNNHFMGLLLQQRQPAHNSHANDNDKPPKKKKPREVNGQPVYMTATK